MGAGSAAAVLLMLGSILTAQVVAFGPSAVDGQGPPFNPNYVLLSVAFLLPELE
ncbi:hypothetical protein [Escherichia coli]|uniref:hypothetical protein n=1 Tax=Escherichia coli TaxID=562 RepID=UPI0013D0183D|nr:hypothetical protein [Escherichia coli]